MMKHEFEALAGYEVSQETYDKIIEPMYMAINLDKASFVKLLNKKALAQRTFSQIWKEMRALAEHLENTCTHYTDGEAREQLHKLAEEWCSMKHGISFHFNEEMKQSCFYPKSITFWERGTYHIIGTYHFDDKKCPNF